MEIAVIVICFIVSIFFNYVFSCAAVMCILKKMCKALLFAVENCGLDEAAKLERFFKDMNWYEK